MKKLLLTTIVALFAVAAASAQIKGQEMEQYRRSSLNMIMIEDPELDPSVAEIVKDAFINNPIPQKYNDHSADADLRTVSVAAVEVTDQDRQEYSAASGRKVKKGGKGGGLGHALASLGGELVGVPIGPTNTAYNEAKLDSMSSYVRYVAYKYVKDQNFAKKAVDKWFNAASGKLDPTLIIDRAYFNASEMEKIQAAEENDRDARSAIMDNGGHEIIGNTFVTVSRFRYLNAEQMANEILTKAALGAKWAPRDVADLTMSTAEMAAEAAKLSIGEGYVIYTTTQLYRLVWNEEIFDKINAVSDDMDAYNALDCFKLEYVGEESAQSLVAKKKRTEEEAVRFATSRALDKVLAKLEKNYEVFRTKTPLLSVSPEITAGIGTKECVEKGDKYEILEKQMKPNKKTGKTEITWKSLGTLTVKEVGNNMGEDNDDENASSSAVTIFGGTVPAKVVAGTLIRQTK